MDLLARFVGIWMVFVVFIAVGVEGGNFGEACNVNGDCTGTNAAKCDSGTSKCICSDGFFRKTTAAECTAKIGFEIGCDAKQTASDQCSVPETECKDDAGTKKCLCKATYYSDGSACQKKIGFEIGCDAKQTASDQCSVPETECKDDAGTKKCLCKATYYSDGSACQKKIGFEIGCDAKQTASDQCSVPETECKDDAGTKKCLCKATYYSDGSACQKKIGFEIGCDAKQTASDQCSVPETECKDDAGTKKCLCKSTYYSDGNACQKRKNPVATCGNDECITHASCINSKCKCDAGYTPSPTTSPTMCSGVVKHCCLPYRYVVSILVSMMFLLR